jgi:hypothetical protein
MTSERRTFANGSSAERQLWELGAQVRRLGELQDWCRQKTDQELVRLERRLKDNADEIEDLKTSINKAIRWLALGAAGIIFELPRKGSHSEACRAARALRGRGRLPGVGLGLGQPGAVLMRIAVVTAIAAALAACSVKPAECGRLRSFPQVYVQLCRRHSRKQPDARNLIPSSRRNRSA